MANKPLMQAQNPLILRCHRLIEAFAKSDDERDFYIDRQEGFIVNVDLDKPGTDLNTLQNELAKNSERYCLIPKMTFYETKKIMEGFVNEKVYDIDTKEKLMEIIGSKEAMQNFIDFLNDHHSELEKWQQFYQERSRVRIIEWLRQNHFTFVFEEDLDLPRDLIEKLKKHLFDAKVDKEIQNVRKEIVNKSKTYYSNEALNPRPKRGRPPKQIVKAEIEPQITRDIFTTVPPAVLPFLFTPSLTTSPANAFSSRFEAEAAISPKPFGTDFNATTDDLKEKLSLLRKLSNRWIETEKAQTPPSKSSKAGLEDEWEEEEEFEEEKEFKVEKVKEKKASAKKGAQKPTPQKSSSKPQPKNALKPSKAAPKSFPKTTTKANKMITKSAPKKTVAPKKATKAAPKKAVKAAPKKAAPKKAVKAAPKKTVTKAKAAVKKTAVKKAVVKKAVAKKPAAKKK